jgi:hypothetical protein
MGTIRHNGIIQDARGDIGMSTTLKEVVLYGVAALALIALAAPAPDVATLLVVILIAGVLLNNWGDYASLFGGK